MTRNSNPRKAGDILKSFLKKQKFTKFSGLKKKVSENLKAVIDSIEDEGEKVFFISISRGVLKVGVESAVVRHELQCFRGMDILEEMRKRVPEADIKKVLFVIETK